MTISDGSPTFDIGPTVSQHNRAEVAQLLSTYTPKKTKTVNIELDIALTDDEPIFHKPRRWPFAERDIVDAQVDEWVKNGIVEPCSSPYASQVVVVKKKRREITRVCIDYRRLNRKLIKDNYPLPLIDDILDCLQNAKIFTTLNLKNGFFHVAVNERSRKFTSFVTHNGQYQFRRMPFGLSTCPSTFMRSTDAAEAINRLETQRHVFGNPATIITDKGSAFTSSAFEDITIKSKTSFISPLQLVS
ncbi:retrovirus-related Pol polyprotein from transposon 412 [Trichonephila clavipes]|nr:retrovirus-related Pol polyprotein from transposon 412 [Trichonephila clavipes]